MAGIREGEPGTADLPGEGGCPEFFASGHHEQIKLGFLGIAEEKVFADFDPQPFANVMAIFNGGGGGVVHAYIGDAQLVQKAISTHFPGKAAGRVRRPACM